MHHQYTAVSHDHGGGTFSFVHATQANRIGCAVLKAVDNLGTYRAVTGGSLAEVDEWGAVVPHRGR